MTYFWQEERGKNYYRLQTDDIEISEKLKRRNGFRLIGQSMNAEKVWLYICQFARPDIALKVLKSISKSKIEKIDSEGLFRCGL
jgi:hypothetical protein